MYQLLKNIQMSYGVEPARAIKRLSDNAFIPFDPANQDFVEYQKWLSLGNTPIPADEPTLPE